MGLTIKKTSWEDYLDPSGEAYVKALIMGVHDAGKTRSASFWPDPIFADTEDGRMSIADRSVPYARIRSSADMDDLLEHLRKECRKPPQSRPYKTLVIDTFDAYQRTIIQERLKSERKESLSGWADWGYLDGKMTQLVERLLNLPMNIIVNLHTKDVNDSIDDTDGDKSILVKKARLKGDIKDSIFQDFDLIGQMETYFAAEGGERVTKRHIRWHSDPRNPNPRDRSGQLPKFTDIDFTDQDYWRIFNAMTSGVEKLPAPETVQEVESSGTADAEVKPAPADEKGGPVEATPEATRAKGARKAAPAKKAAAKPEPKVSIEEPQESKAVEPEPATEKKAAEPFVTDPPRGDEKNGKGTEETPVVLDQNGVVARQLLADGNLRSLDHVHSSDQVCIKNQFGPSCGDPWARPAGEDPTDPPWDTPGAKAPTEKAAPTSVQTDEPAAETAAAEEVAAEVLGAEVISEPGARNEGECGYIPPTHTKFTDQPPGCAKDLATENKAKVNLSLLRAHAQLCESCFDAWRAKS